MRRLCLLLLLAAPAAAQPILDQAAVPGLSPAGRASYAKFLQINLPRTFAVGSGAPAAHGSGGSTNLSAQYDDLRQMVAEVLGAATRLGFVQFARRNAFAGDLRRPRRPVRRPLRRLFAAPGHRRCAGPVPTRAMTASASARISAAAALRGAASVTPSPSAKACA